MQKAPKAPKAPKEPKQAKKPKTDAVPAPNPEDPEPGVPNERASRLSKIGSGLGKNPGEMGGIAQQVYCALTIVRSMESYQELYVGYDDHSDVSISAPAVHENETMLEPTFTLFEVKYSKKVKNLKETLEDSLIRIKLDDSKRQQILVICCDTDDSGEAIVSSVVESIKQQYSLDREFLLDNELNPFAKEVFALASTSATLRVALDHKLEEIFNSSTAREDLLNQLDRVLQMEVVKARSLNEWLTEINTTIKRLWPSRTSLTHRAILASLLISTQTMTAKRSAEASLLLNLIDVPMGSGLHDNKVDCLRLKQKLDNEDLTFSEESVTQCELDLMMLYDLSGYTANNYLRSFYAFVEALYGVSGQVDYKASLVKSFIGSMTSRPNLDDIDAADFKLLGFGTHGQVTAGVTSKLDTIAKKKIVKVCGLKGIFNNVDELNEAFGGGMDFSQ